MRIGVAAALAFAAAVGTALAQTATPEPATPKKEAKGANWLAGQPVQVGPKGPAYENVRKALDALTPEQRKRFQENFMRWANLSPEEKKALRDREEVRKKMVEQESEAAIQESGLQLDGERREQFIKRYSEGRRLIEEQLRKEMNEKRKPLVHELVGRLRNEFGSEAPLTVAPQTASPTPTAKP
ncbi:MAG: DUF3106 domain-containing protein [Chthoniobacter sp.]|uniref:DUF3106 domain-containing protein n=1 Tax=Chthoniobacter sp. TaxID=2510640 RepID=UPI0032A77AEE